MTPARDFLPFMLSIFSSDLTQCYFINWLFYRKTRLKFEESGLKIFLGIIKKVDDSNIVLQYKPGNIFYREHFYIEKKRYTIDFSIICDYQKLFIYSLIDFSNTIYNAQIWVITQIYQHPIQVFILGQYLTKNSAYSPTKYKIPLYKGLEIS